MSRMGRTCSVPTEAWAYQVPLLPYLRNTWVSASVYSARCSSGTAQSSMKLTGLPSPLRLIMMFRPALRTSHRFFCGASSAIRTTEPGRPRSPISSTSCVELAQQRRLVAAGELHQQHGIGLADHGGADHRREGRVLQRQLDHGAIDQFHRGQRAVAHPA